MRLESKGKMAQVQGFPGSNLLKVNIPETTFTLKRKTQEPSSPKNGNMWFEAATEPQRTLVILMRKALTEKKYKKNKTIRGLLENGPSLQRIWRELQRILHEFANALR